MRISFRGCINPAVLAVVFLGCATAYGNTVTINFDQNPNGSPIYAPNQFSQAQSLTNLYAPLGIHFAGYLGSSAWPILNDYSGFGVAALSGQNYLAYSSACSPYCTGAQLQDGSTLGDPLVMTFDGSVKDFSIWASAGLRGNSYAALKAFNSRGKVVAETPYPYSSFGYGWTQLAVHSNAYNIKYVELTVPGGNAAVFDNLQYVAAVPIPPAAVLFGSGMLALFGFAKRKRGRSGSFSIKG